MTKLKLAAIGDSLCQGFQSGAISKTSWSFPAIVARSFGLDVPGDFLVPHVPGPGLPLNIEDMLRKLELRVGPELGAAQLARTLQFIPDYLDEMEDYHERGVGSLPTKFSGVYHNLSVWGFALAEALSLTPKRCRRAIKDSEGWIEDDFLGLPSGPMYRTAQRVLNPGDIAERRTDTQLDALERSLKQRAPIDALILWLGANDALGTVLTLSLNDMAREPADALPSDPVELLKWNLTSEERFRSDYADICERVGTLLDAYSPNTRVFVGTVPYVTIPPLARGVGHFDGKYFDNYRRFFVNSDGPGNLLEGLSRDDVITIEKRIDSFNRSIREQVGARQNWHIVETAALMDRLALRRNLKENEPDEPLRAELRADHPLLALDPVPNVFMYQLDAQGRRVRGGLFSLDGIHPTTIGYGLIAESFLKVMRDAGVPGADPLRLPWNAVIANDTLIQHPPRLWHSMLAEAERHATFWALLARALA